MGVTNGYSLLTDRSDFRQMYFISVVNHDGRQLNVDIQKNDSKRPLRNYAVIRLDFKYLL